MADTADDKNTPPGPGVDASGQAVVDPTRNVLDKFTDAVDRLDDLRQADAQAMRAMADLRDRYEDKLRAAESARLDERFAGIERERSLIERQRVEQKADTEKAVQAALSAAKEAVQEQTTAFALATAKSEAATTKSIEQLGDTFTTAFEGFRRELGDLKDRVINMETQKVSSTDVAEAAAETRRAIQELTERLGKIA